MKRQKTNGLIAICMVISLIATLLVVPPVQVEAAGSTEGASGNRVVYYEDTENPVTGIGTTLLKLNSTEYHGTADFSQVTEGGYFYIEYTGVLNSLIFSTNSWTGGNGSQTVIQSDSGMTEDGKCYAMYSYDNCVEALGTDDFANSLNAIDVGSSTNEISISLVCYYQSGDPNGGNVSDNNTEEGSIEEGSTEETSAEEGSTEEASTEEGSTEEGNNDDVYLVYEPTTILDGFNADVVATVNIVDSTEDDPEVYRNTDAIDGEGTLGTSDNFCFYTASVDTTQGYLPDDRMITSTNAATPGLSWQLAEYTEDNALKVLKDETGTLLFSNVDYYEKVYLLVTASGGNTEYVDMTAKIHYTDGTEDTGYYTVYDWYKNESVATAEYRRYGTLTGTTPEDRRPDGFIGSGPYFTQCAMELDVGKKIQSIEFSNSSEEMILCVYAVSGQISNVLFEKRTESRENIDNAADVAKDTIESMNNLSSEEKQEYTNKIDAAAVLGKENVVESDTLEDIQSAEDAAENAITVILDEATEKEAENAAASGEGNSDTNDSIVLFEGESISTSGSWAVYIKTTNAGGTFDPAVISEEGYFYVEYAGDVPLKMAMQQWNGGSIWAKIDQPSSSGTTADGVKYAIFTYEDCVAAYGNDFSGLDQILFAESDSNNELTVYKVSYYGSSAGDVSGDGTGDVSGDGDVESEAASYRQLVVQSGLNADVIATVYAEYGSTSTDKEIYMNTSGVDCEGDVGTTGYNCFYASSVDSNEGHLPDDRLITSTNSATPGLTWKLEEYTQNNALKLTTDETGILTFTNMDSFEKVYLLVTAGGVDATGVDMNAKIMYTDGTEENRTYVVYDWYKDTEAATSIYKRYGDFQGSNPREASPNGSTEGGPYFTQCVMDVNPDKVIQEMQLSNTTTDMLLCVYAVTGKLTDVTTSEIAIPEISNTSIQAEGPTTFNAVWNAVENAQGYVIDVAKDALFTDVVLNNVSTANVQSYQVSSDLEANTIYYYRVRAVDEDGNQSGSSAVVTVYPKTYTVTLPESTADYTVTAQSSNPVAYDGSFTFTITAEQENALDEIVVSANGVELEVVLTEGSSKTYSVNNITADVTCIVSIQGETDVNLDVEKNEASNRIEQKVLEVGVLIDEKDGIDADQKNVLKAEVALVAASGKADVTSATTVEEITDALTATLDAIDAIVSKAGDDTQEDEFESARENAKSDIDAVAEETKSTIDRNNSLSEEEKQDFKATIDNVTTAGKTAVDNATDAKGITDAVTETKEAIADIVADATAKGEGNASEADAIKQEQTAAKDNIDDAADAAKDTINDMENLSDEEKQGYTDEIDAAVDNGKENVDDADTTEDIQSAEDVAKDALAGIVEDATAKNEENAGITDTLAQAKESAKASIDDAAEEAKDTVDRNNSLSEEEKQDFKAEIDNAATAGKTSVDNATDEKGIADAITAAQDAISGAVADAIAKGEENAQKELETEKDAVADNIDKEVVDAKEELDNLGNLTDEEKQEVLDAIDQVVKEGNAALKDADTKEEIEAAQQTMKDKITAIIGTAIVKNQENANANGNKDDDTNGDQTATNDLLSNKQTAKNELDAMAQDLLNKIDSMQSVTNEQKQAWKEKIQQALTSGKNAIDTALTQDEVDKAKKDAVTSIENTRAGVITVLLESILNITYDDISKNKLLDITIFYNDLTSAQQQQVTNAQNQYNTLQVSIEEAKKGTVSLEESEKTIVNTNTDKGDPAGSTFWMLRLKATGKKKAVKLSWTKVTGADGYIIYGSKCGTKMEQIMEVAGSKKTATIKKLKKGTYYKYIISAYKLVNGEKRIMATSKSAHAVTTGGKFGNPTKVIYAKSKLTIKKGKSKTVKPKMKTSKKVRIHIAKFRYESTDTSIATVNNKGKIKAVSKGTCFVYVYAQNGYYKKIKVKVK